MKTIGDKSKKTWQIGGISLIMALVYGFYCYMGRQGSAVTIALIVDPRSSQALAKKYNKLLTPAFLQEQRISGAAKTIAQDMRSFSGLSLRHLSNRKIVVRLAAKTPLVRINNQFIVTVDGVLVPAHEFSGAILEQLPTIKVQNTHLLTTQVAELAKFIAFLPAVVWEQYQLVWHNKTDIELVGEVPAGSITRISLRACYTTLFSSALLAHIEQLKKELQERVQPKNKNRAPHWCIDLRMEKQLVVSRMLGEER